MSILDKAKEKECLKIANQAKELRKKANDLLEQASEVESRAIIAFRELRNTALQAAQEEKKKLEEEWKALQDEQRQLAQTFCKQNGGHTEKRRTVRTSNRPLYHNFYGDVYPTESYYTCLICGESNDGKELRRHGRHILNKGSEAVVQVAAEQDDNLELKETAQKILAFPEKFEKLKKRMQKNEDKFKEICSLFGHDAGELDIDDVYKTYECKCCGKLMRRDTYTKDHNVAKYSQYIGL